jgi:Flp pilus assembly protein TadG
MTTRPARDARGAATAELAMVLPLLAAVTVGLVWLLAAGAGQLRAVDAARETGAAIAVGQQVAPEGATVHVTTTGGKVHVTVTGEVAGPGGIFAALPPARLHAEAVAVREQGPQ